MKANLFFLACLALLSVSVARADDADPAPKTLGAPTVDPGAAPKKMRKPPTNNDGFVKTKYTSDRSEAEADKRSLLLAVGVDKIIDLDANFKMSDRKEAVMTGNTAVLTVIPASIGDQKQLVIKPVGEGETNITVRDKSGRVKIIFDVTVAKQNLVRYLERLKDKLKEVEGINMAIEDQKVVIRGEVLSPNDYGLIVNEIGDKSYGDTVINKTIMSPVTLTALAKKIEGDIQVFAPTVRSSVLNGKIILDGSVESEAIKSRALRRAEWYLPAIKISDPIANAVNAEKSEKPLQIIQSDIQVVPPPPKRESKLVRMSVYFVELGKDFLKNYGFKWQPGFTADPSISIGSTSSGGTGTSNSSGGFTFAGTLSSLFPTLNAPPSSASYARVLKQETVVVKSGEAAKVKDIQNIPTQTLGQNGATGVGASVPVGFDTSITPTILQGQDVDVNIDLEQSNQIGKGVGGAPITTNHHITTRLYLKSGETAAVGAVNTQDVTTAFNRDDPNATVGSGGIKPIFTLQRSKSSSKARKQFVVFLSPQIIESASEGTEDLKRNFRMPSSNSH